MHVERRLDACTVDDTIHIHTFHQNNMKKNIEELRAMNPRGTGKSRLDDDKIADSTNDLMKSLILS